MFGLYRRRYDPGFVGILLLLTVSLLFDGFVFRCLWNWHAARIFHVRTLNIFEASALVLLVTMFKSPSSKDAEEEPLKSWFKAVWVSSVCFVFGLILYWFT